jgi:hypothetical protein
LPYYFRFILCINYCSLYVHHAQAPNFAFALVSRKYREHEAERARRGGREKDSPRIDLSAMQHMINAAEPVDMSALLAFYEDFMPFGLRPGVIVPTYGLAEHCVYVCSCEPRHFPAGAEDTARSTHLHSSGVRYVAVKKTALEAGEVEPVPRAVEGAAEDLSVRTLVSCGDPSRGEGVCLKIVDPVSLVVLEEGKVCTVLRCAVLCCGACGGV